MLWKGRETSGRMSFFTSMAASEKELAGYAEKERNQGSTEEGLFQFVQIWREEVVQEQTLRLLEQTPWALSYVCKKSSTDFCDVPVCIQK
jgi:hypothetical protein